MEEGKYKEGEAVYPLDNPALKLIVRRYVTRIYYCRVWADQNLPELVYFERELSSQAPVGE